MYRPQVLTSTLAPRRLRLVLEGGLLRPQPFELLMDPVGAVLPVDDFLSGVWG